MKRVAGGFGLLLAAGCFKTVQPTNPADDLPAAGNFPHEIFDAALEGRVDEAGLVDYAAISADRSKLDEYVGYLALASPENHPELFPTREDQLAYWINAYNALAITAVIDRPGLVSVNDNKVDFFYATRYPVGGRKLDLYRMEKGVVRPTFDDPRIHFALNCQSGGCPRLPQDTFPSRGLDTVLDAVTTEFVTNPAKVKIDGTTVSVSQIFEWYAEDFESSGGAVGFVRKYRSDVPDGATLGPYIPYDWTLIAQPGKGP